MGASSIDSGIDIYSKCDLDNGEIYDTENGQTVANIKELSAIEVLKLLGGIEDYRE